MKTVSIRARSRHLFVLDLVGMTVAAIISLQLWLAVQAPGAALGPFLWIIGMVVAARVAANLSLGLYGYSWRYASVGDMGRIVACTVVGTAVSWILVVSAAVFEPSGIGGVPAPVFWITEAALVLAVLATPRFLIRAASELHAANRHGSASLAQRTLLYGAGWAGVMVARSAQRDPEAAVNPVGFLDSDPELAGSRVAGLRVFGGIQTLGRAVRRTKATALLITMPSATGQAVRDVVEAAMDQGLDVRTVPPMTDLLDGSLDANRIQRVRVEDLLRRPPAKSHAPAVHELFSGSTVVVTGGAGSIGSELARQVLAVKPSRIALVDQAESPLYMVLRELEQRIEELYPDDAHPAIEVSTHLEDVSDRAAMERLFKRLRPAVVLHAAAYKHVPVLEESPSRAVINNIGGTAAVVDAAESAGVHNLVLVSTDKAVWPSSVMGASKRVAELVVSEAAERTGRPYISVRFGNVLGSNGSVVPIFQRQLERGQPITITDPESTRYFMTIPEASWLILDAAALADGGGLYVLDMGEPVRIIDIAHDLMRLAGRDPESVPIKVTGLRPGEKLHEELFYDQEGVTATSVPKVMYSDTSVAPRDIRDVRDNVGALTAMADGTREAELKEELHAYVRRCVAGAKGQAGQLPDADELVAIPIVADADAPGRNGNGTTFKPHTNGHATADPVAVVSPAALAHDSEDPGMAASGSGLTHTD